jgi:phosphatidylserine/phosphatidylglycerophosphate/cardiolipin synthase-like enzyme
MQLLEEGVTVSRTADDLIRYHGKMMIVDGRTLHVYGFNFTTLDMETSRSFAVITRNHKLVQEAMKLFEADFNRQPYAASHPRLIISPENSRERLSKFLRGAKKQLSIYDPKITDDAILKILNGRKKAGVQIRIIGKVEEKWHLDHAKYPGRRLHVRTIVRDGSRAFIGSQSLRRLELEKRREIGIIVTDPRVVREIQTVFDEDWIQTDLGKKRAKALKKLEKKAERKGEKLPDSIEERLKLAAAS